MNTEVEIHDSRLLRIDSSEHDVVLRVHAYVHRSEGRPGVDAGTGWTQPLVLRFRAATITATAAEFPLWLLDGFLRLGDHTNDNGIAMPLDFSGPCRLEIEAANSVRIVVEGDGVTGEFEGPAVYVEDFTP